MSSDKNRSTHTRDLEQWTPAIHGALRDYPRTLPARLRMNVMANPGIDRLDFELISLAVSAVNGCGLCITSHERKLREEGVSREAVQSAVRIAAVIHAAACVHEYEGSGNRYLDRAA